METIRICYASSNFQGSKYGVANYLYLLTVDKINICFLIKGRLMCSIHFTSIKSIFLVNISQITMPYPYSD